MADRKCLSFGATVQTLWRFCLKGWYVLSSSEIIYDRSAACISKQQYSCQQSQLMILIACGWEDAQSDSDVAHTDCSSSRTLQRRLGYTAGAMNLPLNINYLTDMESIAKYEYHMTLQSVSPST